MRTLSRSIVAIGLMTIFSAGAVSAQRGNPEEMRARMQERMVAQADAAVTALALEGDRAETVRAILMAQSEKSAALMGPMRGRAGRGQGGEGRGARQGARGDQQGGQEALAERRQQMEAIQQETMGLLGEVLTEDELVKYAEFQASNQRGRRGRAQIQ